MRKLINFIKNMSFVYLILNIIVIYIGFKIKRNFNIDIAYVRTVVSLIKLSLFISFAIEVFKIEKIATFIRIILGYIILFITTLIIRDTFGPWIFRRSFVILMFTFICTLIYFMSLLILVIFNKKEQNDLNNALSRIAEDKKD